MDMVSSANVSRTFQEVFWFGIGSLSLLVHNSQWSYQPYNHFISKNKLTKTKYEWMLQLIILFYTQKGHLWQFSCEIFSPTCNSWEFVVSCPMLQNCCGLPSQDDFELQAVHNIAASSTGICLKNHTRIYMRTILISHIKHLRRRRGNQIFVLELQILQSFMLMVRW